MKPNQPVIVTAGAHQGETGTITGKSVAGWAVKLASGKTVTLSAASLKRGAA